MMDDTELWKWRKRRTGGPSGAHPYHWVGGKFLPIPYSQAMRVDYRGKGIVDVMTEALRSGHCPLYRVVVKA